MREPARAVLMALVVALGAPAAAQHYRPVPGQPGKDVVWIPTPEASVEKMLDLARVGADDFVIDLGSGDGRNVIAAAKRGTRALGVEFNPDLVSLSRRAAAAAGVASRASFVQGDLFEADISGATVLLLFLLPDHLKRLAPRFLALAPGTRIVSNTYSIEGWEPDETVRGEPCVSWCLLHLYVVPARVAGTWRLADGATLTLEQHYQNVRGTMDVHGIALDVEAGRLRGDRLSFVVNGVRYAARVTADALRGEATGRARREFIAYRVD